MTTSQDAKATPDHEELEITLLGPGYGESVVLHIGGGEWVIVDSCIDPDGNPRSLRYLESIGVNPSEAVVLVVATHWHDDHIRGMEKVVETCRKASFCCSAALLKREFLTVVDAWGRRSLAQAGSGVREIFGVFTHHVAKETKPIFALANRRIYLSEQCEIWTLSPSDTLFKKFLVSIGGLLTAEGQTKTRIPDPRSNDVAVALWLRVADVAILLGSDLEKGGWAEVLQDGARPTGKASVFKVAHHGSGSGDDERVWTQMLLPQPYSVLTPWRLGGRTLPSQEDAKRILSYTNNAYVTAKHSSGNQPRLRDRTISRTVRESNVRLRSCPLLSGALQLRRGIDSTAAWRIKPFGPACHLADFTP